MSKLYVVEIEKNVLVTHDGEFQLGFFRMDLKTFLEKTGVDYEKTYWLPDTVSKRYKKMNYQNHLFCSNPDGWKTVTGTTTESQSKP